MASTASSPTTLHARWVWSEGRWLESGRVTIVDGWIREVGTERIAGETDLSDQILLPGLVNAHTHLEFSSLPQPIPHNNSFASWIRRVVEWRREQTESRTQDAITQGLVESARLGVTTLGEISTRDQPPPLARITAATSCEPSAGSPRTIVFREALGLSSHSLEPQLYAARRHLEQFQDAGQAPDARQLPGLSPHAPYSLSQELFTGIVDLARQSTCPVAMHIAETREELELLSQGTGPLADLFTEWGLWTTGQSAAFGSQRQVLQALVGLPRVLLIHGNYLNSEELDFLAGRDNLSLIYCPRTHSYFQHDHYPLIALLARGIRVAFGTDSRASNPDLDLLSEMRHAHQLHSAISPATWLEMATRSGAEALGLGNLTGRIAPGLKAEMCLLPIPAGINDPFEVVLGTSDAAIPWTKDELD